MILDTNHDVTAKLGQLKALGYTHLIRYIATGSKSITPAEARAIAAAGIQLVTVYEGYGDTRGELTAAMGRLHAQDYLSRAAMIGQPDGSGFYFAIDSDESVGTIRGRIIPYFQAVVGVIGTRGRVGVYGSGLVCGAILDAGLAQLSWISCSTGWTGYSEFKASGRWNLLQHTPKNIVGLDTDPDEINPNHSDIGAFLTTGATTRVLSGIITDVLGLQARLNALGASPPLVVDGILGYKTIQEIVKYLPK